MLDSIPKSPRTRDVRALERLTIHTPPSQIDPYHNPSDTLAGYASLIRKFIDDTATLPQEEREKLTKFAKLLDDLSNDEEKLWKVYNELLSIKGFFGKGKSLDAYIDSKYDELEKNGEVYLYGGIRTHFEIVKISKSIKDGKTIYNHTVYNAGFEAVETGLDTVAGTYERDIKHANAKTIKQLMKAETYKLASDPTHPSFFRRQFEKIIYYWQRFKIKRRLTGLPRLRDVKPQGKNNCTTRSIREMLRDHLNEHTFKSLIQFIRTNEKSDAYKIYELLKNEDRPFQLNHPQPLKQIDVLSSIQRRDTHESYFFNKPMDVDYQCEDNDIVLQQFFSSFSNN